MSISIYLASTCTHQTWTLWTLRWHGVGSWRVAQHSWSWGSLVWYPHAPTGAQTLWATTTQYSRHCIPTTSSTTYVLHKHLNRSTAGATTNQSNNPNPTSKCANGRFRTAHSLSGGVRTWWTETRWVCLSSHLSHCVNLQGPPGHQVLQGASFQHCPQCCHHLDLQRTS